MQKWPWSLTVRFLYRHLQGREDTWDHQESEEQRSVFFWKGDRFEIIYMHTFCCCCCVLCIFSLFRESLGYQDRKETPDGKVIGYALFVTMCDIRVLKQRRRQWQREWQESNRFRLAKPQACTCTTLLCTFLCRRCTTTTWNFLVSLFLEEVNARQRFVFLFLNLKKVL